MNHQLYRVQAADGRGPWRPGLSKYWIDETSDKPLPMDVLAAFGIDWKHQVPIGWACGCACRTLDSLFAWFTPIEQRRLETMGYTPVSIMAEKILAENVDQVIFARRDPLTRGAIILPWRKAA